MDEPYYNDTVDVFTGRNLQVVKDKCTTKPNCGGFSKAGRTVLVLCEISVLRNCELSIPRITSVVLV